MTNIKEYLDKTISGTENTTLESMGVDEGNFVLACPALAFWFGMAFGAATQNGAFGEPRK